MVTGMPSETAAATMGVTIPSGLVAVKGTGTEIGALSIVLVACPGKKMGTRGSSPMAALTLQHGVVLSAILPQHQALLVALA